MIEFKVDSEKIGSKVGQFSYKIKPDSKISFSGNGAQLGAEMGVVFAELLSSIVGNAMDSVGLSDIKDFRSASVMYGRDILTSALVGATVAFAGKQGIPVDEKELVEAYAMAFDGKC